MRRFGYNSQFLLSMCLGMTLLISACNSPTGNEIEEDDRPDIPTLEAIDMNVSYFQSNQPPQGEADDDEYQNYMEARSVVLERNLELTNILDQLLALQEYNAAFGGGHPIEELWRWFITYNFNYNTELNNDFLGFHLGLLEILILAEVDESSQQAAWEVFVSGCTQGEEETQLDDPCFEFEGADPEDAFQFLADHKLMEGTVSLDRRSGEWSLFTPAEPSPNPPYINIEWTVTSNQNKTFKVSVTEDALLILEIIYTESDGDFQMDISGASIDTRTVVGWDTALEEGYLERPNQVELICWRGDLQNRAC